MAELVLNTFDWVPEMPRGFVRDIPARWALEEAGLEYSVRSVPFKDRDADHFVHQPFGQVPWLTDGDLSLFESGAIVVHIGERNEVLLPTDPRRRSDVLGWTFAALNSVEMASLPRMIYRLAEDTTRTPGRQQMDDFLKGRLDHMETVLTDREWLSDDFSIADLLMADVLRPLDRYDELAQRPNCKAYVMRATARPAFVKAYADQMAHFASADESH